MRGRPRLVAALLSLALLAAGAEAADEPLAHEPLADVKKSIDAGKALLVDVRERREWDAAHLRDARLLPMSSIAAATAPLDSLPKDRPLYLHCAVGGRAAKAAQVLKSKGFDARPLLVTFRQLVESGFPLAGKP